MRTILLACAVTLALGGTAFAQMCGGGVKQQTSSTARTSGAAGCMGMMQQTEADDPMADKPAEKQKSGGMMCPCCRSMAMMGGKLGGETEPKHEMPMTPKQ